MLIGTHRGLRDEQFYEPGRRTCRSHRVFRNINMLNIYDKTDGLLGGVGPGHCIGLE